MFVCGLPREAAYGAQSRWCTLRCVYEERGALVGLLHLNSSDDHRARSAAFDLATTLPTGVCALGFFPPCNPRPCRQTRRQARPHHANTRLRRLPSFTYIACTGPTARAEKRRLLITCPPPLRHRLVVQTERDESFLPLRALSFCCCCPRRKAGGRETETEREGEERQLARRIVACAHGAAVPLRGWGLL